MSGPVAFDAVAIVSGTIDAARLPEGLAEPGGVSGDIQYNDNGEFGGFGDWDGSVLTIPGRVVIDPNGDNGLQVVNAKTGAGSYSFLASNGSWFASRNSGGGVRRLFSISANDIVYMGDIDGVSGNTIIRCGGVDTVTMVPATKTAKFTSGVGMFNTTPPSTKPATPTDLAGIIAIGQSYGWWA